MKIEFELVKVDSRDVITTSGCTLAGLVPTPCEEEE